jgi:hypothetical protein
MTFTQVKNNSIKAVPFNKKRENIPLIIHGQGVLLFKHEGILKPCVFYLYNVAQDDGLKIEFTTSRVLVNEIKGGIPLVDEKNDSGLSTDNEARYWFSLDSQNQILYAGVGEARIETIIYQYKFPNTDKDKYEENKLFLESIQTIQVVGDSTEPLRLLRDPITQTVPLFVKDINSLTMNDIADTRILPSANLSTTSQKLYNCISGKRFILDDRDFPDFSKAIEYSINTPGCWCNTTLLSKATEFSKDKPNLAETYLRITLGHNNGESPGIPYVMEIWPAGHYSPIHNHGGANAVIRVLNGSIQVSLFPYLSPKVKPFGIKEFKKEDVTWISPTLNQIHQLKNVSKKVCVTIQCYIYESEDTVHYDYFDYLDEVGKIEQYEPDSDMGFLEFKKTMKREWAARRWC